MISNLTVSNSLDSFIFTLSLMMIIVEMYKIRVWQPIGLRMIIAITLNLILKKKKKKKKSL